MSMLRESQGGVGWPKTGPSAIGVYSTLVANEHDDDDYDFDYFYDEAYYDGAYELC